MDGYTPEALPARRTNRVIRFRCVRVRAAPHIVVGSACVIAMVWVLVCSLWVHTSQKVEMIVCDWSLELQIVPRLDAVATLPFDLGVFLLACGIIDRSMR